MSRLSGPSGALPAELGVRYLGSESASDSCVHVRPCARMPVSMRAVSVLPSAVKDRPALPEDSAGRPLGEWRTSYNRLL